MINEYIQYHIQQLQAMCCSKVGNLARMPTSYVMDLWKSLRLDSLMGMGVMRMWLARSDGINALRNLVLFKWILGLSFTKCKEILDYLV